MAQQSTRALTVEVDVDLDTEAYILNYGREDDTEEHLASTVEDAVRQALSRTGDWASLDESTLDGVVRVTERARPGYDPVEGVLGLLNRESTNLARAAKALSTKSLTIITDLQAGDRVDGGSTSSGVLSRTPGDVDRHAARVDLLLEVANVLGIDAERIQTAYRPRVSGL